MPVRPRRGDVPAPRPDHPGRRPGAAPEGGSEPDDVEDVRETAAFFTTITGCARRCAAGTGDQAALATAATGRAAGAGGRARAGWRSASSSLVRVARWSSVALVAVHRPTCCRRRCDLGAVCAQRLRSVDGRRRAAPTRSSAWSRAASSASPPRSRPPVPADRRAVDAGRARGERDTDHRARPGFNTMFGRPPSIAAAAVVTVVVFFPVFVNTIRGLREVDPVHRELLTARGQPGSSPGRCACPAPCRSCSPGCGSRPRWPSSRPSSRSTSAGCRPASAPASPRPPPTPRTPGRGPSSSPPSRLGLLFYLAALVVERLAMPWRVATPR